MEERESLRQRVARTTGHKHAKKKKKKSPRDLERGGIITLGFQKRGAKGMEVIDLRLSAPEGN